MAAIKADNARAPDLRFVAGYSSQHIYRCWRG